MTFNQAFKVDEINRNPLPAAMVGRVSSAGIFEDGLFSVLDERLSDSVLISWRWLLGGDAIALISSAFGDLFFWSERQRAVYFLDVQRGESTFVDRDIDSFLDYFLTQDGVLSSVFYRENSKLLADRLGGVKYGECYIAEPWIRHGGSGDLSTFTKGDLAVYTNLVGQSVEQFMQVERSRLR